MDRKLKLFWHICSNKVKQFMNITFKLRVGRLYRGQSLSDKFARSALVSSTTEDGKTIMKIFSGFAHCAYASGNRLFNQNNSAKLLEER